MSEPDLYAVLGVPRDASDRDIKRAYRKLALQYHPDRNPDPAAQEKFKDMTEAFEILSNEEKRRLYDQYGMRGVREGPPPTSIFDILSGNSTPEGSARRSPNRTEKIRCTLAEAYTGCERRKRLTRECPCASCKGYGTKSGKKPEQCPTCKGRGIVIQTIQHGPMIQQFQSQCDACRGQGRRAAPGDVCPECRGNCVVEKQEVITVTIEAGMTTGDKITFYGKGDSQPGLSPGDLIFVVQVEDDENFRRKGADLLIRKSVPLADILAGPVIQFNHLDKRPMAITVAPGVIGGENSLVRVKGEGMRVRRSNDFGDLYILVNVEMPSGLSAEQLTEAARILGYKPANVSNDAETHTGTIADPEQFGTTEASARGRNAYEEDQAQPTMGMGPV